jgi:tyrosyl-tRNA synthetase
MELSEELKWRGFINQTTIKEINLLDKKKYKFYHGFDASVDSLTIGNLAAVMLDKCFIKHGHQATIVAGGATSLIGDPGGKDAERPLQSREVIEANVKAVQVQLKNLLGSDTRFVNNLDWLSKLSVLDFLRDVGKYFSMTPLVQRDYIAKRMGPDGSGISYTELSYTLLQGYDYLYLNKTYQVDLQISGSDQWGNCLSGVELIKKVTGNSVDVFTCPLIINQVTGKKFGKSETGAIWLDANKTSPLDFYQFWINIDDLGVVSYLKIFTELGKSEIDDIEKQQSHDPSSRIAQKQLAYEVTKLVHGLETANSAVKASQVLVNKDLENGVDIQTATDLKKFFNYFEIKTNNSVIDLLVRSGLATSNTEAGRLIDSGSIYINNIKLTNDVKNFQNYRTKVILLRRGKAFKDSVLLEIKN